MSVKTERVEPVCTIVECVNGGERFAAYGTLSSATFCIIHLGKNDTRLGEYVIAGGLVCPLCAGKLNLVIPAVAHVSGGWINVTDTTCTRNN